MIGTTMHFNNMVNQPAQSICRSCILLALSLCMATPSRGQQVGDLPRPAYYVARELFRAGNIQEAAKGFDSVLNNAVRTSTDGWIDGIPPTVMMGECYFQQGNLSQALEFYNAALAVALKFPGWLDQYNLGEIPLAVSDPAAKGIDWFRLSRPSRSLAVPESVQLLIDITQARVNDAGDVVAPLHLLSRLDTSEVMKCLGVALIRRWQILGPLASHSALTNSSIQYFTANLQHTHPWAHSSWLALRGLALLSRDEGLAVQQLRSATLIRDQYDYFMSPLCLMAQGRVAALRGQYQAAIVHFQDASILSAQYEQYELLSESITWLGDCGNANERIDLIDALQSASNWTNKRTPLGLVACLSGAAELKIYSGNPTEAKKLITRMAALLRSRDVALPRFQARLAFLESFIALTENQTATAWNRLTAALTLMRGNAATGAIPERIFQKQLVLDLLASNQITVSDADRILSLLLAEPSPPEWEVQPLETLSALTTPSLPAYMRWLKTGDAQDPIPLVARMDRIQQQQLYEALPLGGRKLAWRTAAALPVDQLPPDVRATIQRASMKYPAIRQIPSQLVTVIEQLRQLPLPLDDRQIKPDTRQLYGRMESLNEQLDNLILTQSVSRQSIRRFTPSEWNLQSTQQRLSPEDLVVSFIVAGDELFAVAISQQQFDFWRVADLTSIQSLVVSLLRQIGLMRTSVSRQANDVLGAAAPWRRTAADLYAQLFSANCQNMIQSAERIIVVPHGFLWNLPFELLVGPGGESIVAERGVTYLPTLGSIALAYGNTRPPGEALAVVGNLFSLDKSINSREAKMVADAAPNTAVIYLDQKNLAPSSAWLRYPLSELVVLNQIDTVTNGWAVRPIPIDAQTGGSLIDWLQSPQATPEWVLLPGLQTMTRTGEISNGNDLFLTACGILYGGSRGVVSRWPVGGMSSSRYLQRVRQEIHSNNTLSGASRRAILALWAEQFTTADEPVLKPVGNDGSLLTGGEHPLLWASYMAIGDRMKP